MMTRIDRRTVIGATIAAGAFGAAVSAQTPPPATGGPPPVLPDPTETIDLWPSIAPGAPTTLPVETVDERSKDKARNDRAVTGISRPRLVVFRPARPNGAAMLVMPGGGYSLVVIDKEGYELGHWLAARGITAFILFYRLPHQGWTAGPNAPLQDAQRALRLIRQRATDYAVDPLRVGAIGFSAGGHLCANLAVRFDAPIYAPVDAADTLSARPVLAAPIYPVVSMTPPVAHAGSRTNMLGATPTLAQERLHSPDRNVTAETPPCFLVHAEDDRSVPVANTLLFRQALKDKGIAVETHLFTEGGHGFGLRGAIGKPTAAWPDLFLTWARSRGMLG